MGTPSPEGATLRSPDARTAGTITPARTGATKINYDSIPVRSHLVTTLTLQRVQAKKPGGEHRGPIAYWIPPLDPILTTRAPICRDSRVL